MSSHCLWIGTCLVVGAANVHAYPEDYGPFGAGEAPTNCCVKPWVCVRDEPSKWMFSPGSNSTMNAVSIEKVEREEENSYVLTITNGGKQIFRYVTTDVGPSGWVLQAYTGLINNDKVPDYVVVTGGTGNGILGWHQIVFFILSTQGSYKAVPIESWGANPLTDLVDINGDGQCEFIQTSFIEGDKGKDGRYHNYWVHNLLRFEGSRCVSANKLHHRFPRWVWFMFKPNHADTDQITKQQRLALWRKQGWGEMHYPQYPYKALADDQKR